MERVLVFFLCRSTKDMHKGVWYPKRGSKAEIFGLVCLVLAVKSESPASLAVTPCHMLQSRPDQQGRYHRRFLSLCQTALWPTFDYCDEPLVQSHKDLILTAPSTKAKHHHLFIMSSLSNFDKQVFEQGNNFILVKIHIFCCLTRIIAFLIKFSNNVIISSNGRHNVHMIDSPISRLRYDSQSHGKIANSISCSKSDSRFYLKLTNPISCAKYGSPICGYRSYLIWFAVMLIKSILFC